MAGNIFDAAHFLLQKWPLPAAGAKRIWPPRTTAYHGHLCPMHVERVMEDTDGVYLELRDCKGF